MNYVEEAITMWGLTRAGTLAELENIPEEQWDFRAGPGARTLREVARHILESGEFFTHELLKEDGSFMRSFDVPYRSQVVAHIPEAKTKGEMLDLLKSFAADEAKRLRDVGEALATQTMKTSKGEDSRLKAVWFAVSHEMYHRGQLTVYERAMGETPAMTKQTEARKKA